ncbi:MAG: FAD-dependent oxidoreductase [Bacteroidota bacterium]
MKRRNALKKIALGTSLGLATPPLLSSCFEEDPPGPEVPFDGNVIILGAGVAGLHAANILTEKGIEVQVLEASDRIGGRIRSTRAFPDDVSADFPLEYGADWILGENSSWFNTLQEAGIQLTEIGVDTSDNYIIDNQLTSILDASADPDFVDAINFLNNLNANVAGGPSVQEAIEQAGINPRVHEILNGLIGNRYGAANSQLDIVALAEARRLTTAGNRRFVFSGNPQEDVVRSLFFSLNDKILLNTQAVTVDYNEDEIIVIDQNDIIYKCRKLLVTVPITVLKDGDITFLPALPARKQQVMTRIGMDNAIKMFIRFNRTFYGETTGSIFGSDAVPEYYNVGVGRSEQLRVLNALIYGDLANNLAGMSSEALLEYALNDLDQYFDDFPSNDLNNFGYFDWSTEPFIRGAFSYPLPGAQPDDRATLAESIRERVYFAGEATNLNGNFGTVHGAFESAERATQEIVDDIIALMG